MREAPDSPTAWLVAIGAAVLLIGVLWLGARLRRRAMAAHAAERDWSFSASEPSLVDRFTEWPFGEGRSPEALDVVHTSVAGREVLCFEYAWNAVGAAGSAHLGPWERGVVAVVLGDEATEVGPRLVGQRLLPDGEPGHRDGDAVVFVHPERLLPEQVDAALTRLEALLGSAT